MRKIIAILSALVLLCLSGCSLVPPPDSPDEPTRPTVDALKYRSEYHNALQYQHLSDTEQECYDILYTTVKDAIPTDALIEDESGDELPGVCVYFNTALSKSSMSRLYEAFLKDNPQFFFLDRTYSLEGYQEDGVSVYDTLILQFTLNQRKRQKAIRELDDVIQEIVSHRPKTDDEYIIEKYFHDYLITHCAYDEEAAEDGSEIHENAYSVYGALVDGWSVCEGYAKAMQLLLNQVDIPATVIMGHSVEDGESHMWNLVRINGDYYNLDVTWDDNDDIPMYTYFNVTDSFLSLTHEPEKNQLIDIACDEDDDNYFERTDTYCETAERDDIAQIIAQRVKEGDTAIHIMFAPRKYESALLFLKNMQQVQKAVNNRLSGRNTMWDYSLHTHAKQCVITLIKSD